MKLSTVPRALLLLLLAGLTFLASSAGSAETGDLLPNLVPLKASELRVENTSDGRRLLRFTTTSWNAGAGPLILVARSVGSGQTQQQVDQRIMNVDGSSRDVFAGFVAYHPTHSHFHFNDYANYTLQPIDAPGASARTGVKTTFCIIDTTKVNTRLPGAPKRAVYTSCGNQVQGMSVGWGDAYRYYLDGQSLDITGLPDGDYSLEIEVDPKGLLVESNDDDNVSSLRIRLTGGTVQVLEGKGRGPR